MIIVNKLINFQINVPNKTPMKQQADNLSSLTFDFFIEL